MRPILSSVSALVLGSGAGIGLSFALALLIGRGWGTTGLGVYTAALAWIVPLSLLTEAGLGTLFVRDLARQPDYMAAYTWAAIRQRVLVGGVLILILGTISIAFEGEACLAPTGCSQTPSALILSAPLIVILPLYATFTALLRVQGRMTWVAVLNTGMLAAQVLLTALAWAMQAPLAAVLLINTLTSAGQCAAAAWVTREAWIIGTRAQRAAPLHIDLKTLIRRGGPFAAAAVIAALQMRLILIVLEQATTPADVGLYAAAFKGIEIGRVMALAVFDAFFPVLSALAAQQARLRRTFATLCAVLTAAACLGSLALAAFAPAWIPLIYGAAFAPAAPVLPLLAWGLPFLVLRQARIVYGYALGAERRVTVLMLVGLLGQAAAAWALIPLAGVMGAAAAFVLGEAWGAALLWGTRLDRATAVRD